MKRLFPFRWPVRFPLQARCLALVVLALVAWLSLPSGAAGLWSTALQLPIAIQEVSVTSLNGQIYVVGGSTNQSRVNTVYVLDPAATAPAWTTRAPYPGTARDHIGIAAIGNFLYLVGGVAHWPSPSVNTVQRYDSTTNTWTDVAPLPVARGAIATATLNGMIYAAGGLVIGASVPDFTAYDPTANAWQTLPPMPTARDHAVGVALNGKFYVTGGRATSTCAPLTTVEVFDPVANSWSTAAPMRHARGGHAAAVVNGKLYVFGGEGAPSTCGTIASTEEYDPATNTWTDGPPMITPRHGTGGAAVGSLIFAPGGGTATGDAPTRIVEKLDTTATLSLPAPWTSTDIGNVGLAGSATHANGLFTVRGAGLDIWGSADAFHYMYQPFTGDGQITVRVASTQNTHTYAKAGVMLRGALTANAAHVMLDVKPGGGLEFMTRTVTGGATTFLGSATPGVPVWLKLARAGATVMASWSTDTAVWTEAGRTTTTLPATVYAGVPVTSHSTSLLNTSTFDHVSVTAGPVNQPPTVSITAPTPGVTFPAPASVSIAATATDVDGTISSVQFFANGTAIGTDPTSPYGITWNHSTPGSYTLTAVATDSGTAQTQSAGVTISIASPTSPLPASWTSTDIGNVGLAGSATHANGVFTVRGAGLDIWGSADAFHYTYQPFTGDGEIVARVASIQNTHTYAKAGVMLRGALTANAAHVMLDVKPGGGLEFMTRTVTGGATTFLGSATPGVPVWLKLARAGATVMASWSTDTAVWTEAGRTTTTLPATVYAGVPVTSHSTSLLNTSTFDHVSVTAGPVNQPPTVSITAPTPGVTFPAPASVSIAATATDADGTISSVQFFANGTAIGTDPTSPYGITWNHSTPGSYTLTAVATDSGTAQTQSAGVTISIASPTSPLPASWANADVGNVGLAGSATHANGMFTVKGAGADIWNSADAFHYMYQPFTGDGEIVARVASIQNTHTYAKAGVMLRGALTANAAHVMLDVKPGGGLEFMTRTVTGGATTFLGSATPGVPVWLKLARAGATVMASWSTDTAVWTEVGRTTTTLPATVYAGVPVTSHSTSLLNTSTFDHVSVTAGPVNQPPTVSITAPTPGVTFPAPASVSIAATATDADGTISSVQFFANGTAIGTDPTSPYGITWNHSTPGSYTLTAVATDSGTAQTQSAGVTISIASPTSPLPASWANADVGNVGLAGSATHANGMFTVKGAGADIWNSADAFHYVYQPLTGDGQITVRVTSLQNTHTFAKTGVMFRQSLAANSPHVMLAVRPNAGVELVSRPATSASTMLHGSLAVPLPSWLKLIRRGNSFASYTSGDGSLWTQLDSVDVPLTQTVYAGLPVLSHTITALTTATLDSVIVSTDATPPASTISFRRKGLAVGGATSGSAYGIAGFDGPTSLQLGPDGRLYVATFLGKLYILTLNHAALSSPTQAAVDHVQQLDDIYLKPSRTCNINGDPFRCEYLSAIGSGRLVTGVLVDPASTSNEITVYVSNSGWGQGTTDMSLDTYSGIITRLTLVPEAATTNPNDFRVAQHTDLVVGLPRSREVHAVNGMSVGPDGWLYLTVGGHTNAGKASNFFANLPEYYLSASVVRLNPSQLAGRSLPIDVSGVRTAADMAPLAGVFELYATGYRNGYDVTWHSNGKLYLNDNASNLGQGNTPGTTDGCNTPTIAPGNRADDLNLVTRGAYGGHPNPTHGECVFDGGELYSPPRAPHPSYIPPLLAYANGSSTNGLAEYRSDAFDGLMRGNLISATYAGNQNIRRVVLNSAGTAVLQEHNLATFTQPLDVETDVAGNIYVAEYGADRITVMIPAAVGACPVPGTDPAQTDSDADEYSDADETANGSDPCSAASRPADFDGDFLSDLNDPDDDNDGIPDVSDQLLLDVRNGSTTSVPLGFEYNPTEPARGFVANTGFRGVQVASSGVGLSTADIKAGDAGGHLTLTTHTGTAEGAANDQVNALQIGFDSTSPFRILARIVEPFSSSTPGGSHAGGIFFGPDQDNFFRVALVGTATGGMAVQAGLETSGEFGVRGTIAMTVSPVSTVDLVLAGDPATSTVAAYVDVNATGTLVPVVVGLSVPGVWFSNNSGAAASTSLAGIMTSHGSSTPTAVGFDFFRIDRSAPEPASELPAAPDDISPANGLMGVEALARDNRRPTAISSPR